MKRAKDIIKPVFLLGLCCLFQTVVGQETSVLTLSEFLGHVKKFHPIVRQSNLILTESETKLLKARGSFDPQLEVDYGKKEFKETVYADKLNAAFKIPTWYGVALVGNFENNQGQYLNPEASTPDDGLYSLGASLSLAKGLLINERMATLKQAKLYRQEAAATNQQMVNQILFDAASAYFNWLKSYRQQEVYRDFVANAELRLQGVTQGFELGEKPAMDTVEAGIIVHTRKLNFEKAHLRFQQAALELSNYLWINDVPVEIQNNIIPHLEVSSEIEEALQIGSGTPEMEWNDHPKIRALQYKTQALEVEKKLQTNNLLPQIDLKYNFLTESVHQFNPDYFKTQIAVSFPLFLRKARADLRLTNIKLEAINYEKQFAELALKNKLTRVLQEISSYERQLIHAKRISTDYATLLKGEELKFNNGESSIFLINSRESKLIENLLKVIEVENEVLIAKGKLFNTLGIF